VSDRPLLHLLEMTGDGERGGGDPGRQDDQCPSLACRRMLAMSLAVSRRLLLLIPNSVGTFIGRVYDPISVSTVTPRYSTSGDLVLFCLYISFSPIHWFNSSYVSWISPDGSCMLMCHHIYYQLLERCTDEMQSE
jgi:hypothetical protein